MVFCRWQYCPCWCNRWPVKPVQEAGRQLGLSNVFYTEQGGGEQVCSLLYIKALLHDHKRQCRQGMLIYVILTEYRRSSIDISCVTCTKSDCIALFNLSAKYDRDIFYIGNQFSLRQGCTLNVLYFITSLLFITGLKLSELVSSPHSIAVHFFWIFLGVFPQYGGHLGLIFSCRTCQ